MGGNDKLAARFFFFSNAESFSFYPSVPVVCRPSLWRPRWASSISATDLNFPIRSCTVN